MKREIEGFLRYCGVELNLSGNTASAYRADLVQVAGFLQENGIENIGDVTTEVLEKYLLGLSDLEVSPRSVNRKLSAMNTFFKFLIDEKKISFNPCTKLQKPIVRKNLPEFLTDDEIEKLLNTALEENGASGVRNACIISLLYSAGMRVSEMVNLELSSLYWDHGGLLKCQIKCVGKGNKERIVPISRQAAEFLGKYLELRAEVQTKSGDEKWLFPSRKGGHITRVWVGLMLAKIARQAGVDEKKAHPHALRHSLAIKLVNNGMDIRLVQHILGHESLSTTAIYTQINPREIVNFVQDYHPMASVKNKNPFDAL